MSDPTVHMSAALADESLLGPAMRALTPRRRAFVDAMFAMGDTGNNLEYARAAGFKGDNNALAVYGHRLAHDAKIQAAIREEAERRCSAFLPIAARKIEEIALKNDHKDQFAALKHVQSLAGLSPRQKIEVEHKHDRKALIADIKGALELLKAEGVTINLEQFTDVTPKTDPGSTEGLDDLL